MILAGILCGAGLVLVVRAAADQAHSFAPAPMGGRTDVLGGGALFAAGAVASGRVHWIFALPIVFVFHYLWMLLVKVLGGRH